MILGADEEIRTPDRPRANRLAFSRGTQGRRITVFPPEPRKDHSATSAHFFK
jgi:hypothetical protein